MNKFILLFCAILAYVLIFPPSPDITAPLGYGDGGRRDKDPLVETVQDALDEDTSAADAQDDASADTSKDEEPVSSGPVSEEEAEGETAEETAVVEIPLPKGKGGVCLVNVGEDDVEATTLVIRSDLDLIAIVAALVLGFYVNRAIVGRATRIQEATGIRPTTWWPRCSNRRRVWYPTSTGPSWSASKPISPRTASRDFPNSRPLWTILPRPC